MVKGRSSPTVRAAHRASEYSHSIDGEIDYFAATVSPAFLCRIPGGLVRATENQRDSQELVIYLVDIGGQGRNRTTDTRIFRASVCRPFPQDSAGNHPALVVEAEIDCAGMLALSTQG
jgi:hypothetical protein